MGDSAFKLFERLGREGRDAWSASQTAAKGAQVADHSQQGVEHLRDDVKRILNRASESGTSAAKVLKAIADQAEDSLSKGGRAVGFLEEARYEATDDKKDGDLADATWKKTWTYHLVGGALTPLGGGLVGDPLQRGVDATTTAWLQDKSDEINENREGGIQGDLRKSERPASGQRRKQEGRRGCGRPVMKKCFRARAAGALLGLSLLTSGCGSSHEYAIPEDVCGVPVGEKELSALLPDGEKIEVTDTSIVSKSGSNCDVSVDDFPAVSLTVEQVDKFYDPMSKRESFRFTNRKKMAPLPFDGSGAMGDKNIMISTSCGLPEVDHLVVLLIARDKSGKDVEKHRSDMQTFMVDFVPRVKKAMGCSA